MSQSRTSASGVLLAVAAIVTTQAGAAIAIKLFDHVGGGGAVFLRLLGAAIILTVVFRPRFRDLTRQDLLVLLAFGAPLGVMNIAFFHALERVPLGVGVTIELLGPLTLSVILARRVLGWVAAAIAVAGVFLMSGVFTSTEPLDPLGVWLCVLAAFMWAIYILMSRTAGARFPGTTGLAMALWVGAVLALPFGVSAGGAKLLDPLILGWGLLVALMSSAVPYALDMAALRRIAPAVFSILLSLSPAVASVSGWLMLGQGMSLANVVGIGLVMLASTAAVLMGRRQSGGRAASS